MDRLADQTSANKLDLGENFEFAAVDNFDSEVEVETEIEAADI